MELMHIQTYRTNVGSRRQARDFRLANGQKEFLRVGAADAFAMRLDAERVAALGHAFHTKWAWLAP